VNTVKTAWSASCGAQRFLPSWSKRFVAGQSVIRVADWVYKSKPKGLEERFAFNLPRRKLAFRQDVVEQIQQNHEPSSPPEPIQAERIAEAIKMTPMPRIAWTASQA
jgi:hypothetical protein